MTSQMVGEGNRNYEAIGLRLVVHKIAIVY